MNKYELASEIEAVMDKIGKTLASEAIGKIRDMVLLLENVADTNHVADATTINLDDVVVFSNHHHYGQASDGYISEICDDSEIRGYKHEDGENRIRIKYSDIYAKVDTRCKRVSLACGYSGMFQVFKDAK